MRRFGLIFAIVVFGFVLHGSASATTQAEGALGQFDRLIAEQEAGEPIAVDGSAGTGGDGIVVMELVPSQAVSEQLEVGDSYPQLIVAAAEVDANSRYQIRLDPDAKLLTQSRQFVLTYYDEAGQARGFGAGTLPSAPDRFLTGSARGGSIPPVEVDLAVTEASTAEDTEQTAETGSAADLATDNNCDWFVRRTGIEAPATIAVAGTNTNGAKVGAEFQVSASSSLGFSGKVGSGGWVEGSGSYSVTNTSGVTKTWPGRNSYGTYSYRMQVEYREEELVCIYNSTPQWRQVPVRYTGGNFDPVKWSNTQYPRYCVPQGLGTISIERSRATKWNSGVKLGWPSIGSINVDSQSGYNTRTKVTFEFTKTNRYLCGRNDIPAGTPGYMMADWKDR